MFRLLLLAVVMVTAVVVTSALPRNEKRAVRVAEKNAYIKGAVRSYSKSPYHKPYYPYPYPYHCKYPYECKYCKIYKYGKCKKYVTFCSKYPKCKFPYCYCYKKCCGKY